MGHLQPPRLSFVSWNVPVHKRDEIRCNAREKTVVRDASNPTVESPHEVKRTERYFQGRPRCVLSFRLSSPKANTWTVVVDSHWAGCPEQKLKQRQSRKDAWKVLPPIMYLKETLVKRTVFSSGQTTQVREQSHNDLNNVETAHVKTRHV